MTDPVNGRKYLLLANGDRTFFPDRIPKTIRFPKDETDSRDPYARLFNETIVKKINSLNLPRYGLGNYVASQPDTAPNQAESKALEDLGRAGKRLMGFCRTNLFKRLESSGLAFIQSLERHVLRNYIFQHAIENGLPLPIGSTDPSMLDLQNFDADSDDTRIVWSDMEDEAEEYVEEEVSSVHVPMSSELDYKRRAKETYDVYRKFHKRRFKWLRPELFVQRLGTDLKADSDLICSILSQHGT